MSGPLEKAIDVLRDSETRLRKLLSDAAAEGAYDDLARITICAREVSGLLARASDNEPSEKSNGTPTGPDGFPKFYKEHNRLVLKGWSKKSQKIYTHKTPHVVLN
jgi:hypothetical protein